VRAAAAAFFLGAGVVAGGRLAAPARAQNAPLELGRKVFEDNCAKCHGRSGKGDGPDAKRLGFFARDFTFGAFKCRCTPTGQPPTDEDLMRTLRVGLPGTPMVPVTTLTDEQRAAVVAYIKTLSKAFVNGNRAACPAAPVPPRPLADLVNEGKQLYEKMQCAKCHGVGGRGNGPSAKSLVDDWKRSIKPYDFVSEQNMLKCGNDDRDLFRTLTTGMTGSPMPSFSDALAFDTAGLGDGARRDLVEHRVWAIVAYLRSLSK
jgi:cytochrome c oxidase cbb3-type subunit 2